MVPRPIPLGLTICEKVIVEDRTKNVTLVSTFNKLVVDSFPSLPQRFALYSALTDGFGEGTIDVVVARLETDEVVYTQQFSVRFPSRLAEVRIHYRIGSCSFPVPGDYRVTLLIDGELLLERRLEVIAKVD